MRGRIRLRIHHHRLRRLPLGLLLTELVDGFAFRLNLFPLGVIAREYVEVARLSSLEHDLADPIRVYVAREAGWVLFSDFLSLVNAHEPLQRGILDIGHKTLFAACYGGLLFVALSEIIVSVPLFCRWKTSSIACRWHKGLVGLVAIAAATCWNAEKSPRDS
jgi:hypothetical protein